MNKEKTTSPASYSIRSSESGDVIEDCATIEEAQKIIEKYEEEDKKEENYTEKFYEIFDNISEEII